MRFGSEEYLQEVRRRSNADEEYRRLARFDSGSYLMIIEAEPDKGISATLTMGYAAELGTMTDVWIGERETDYTLSGRYGVWVRILTGELDLNKAMMMGKLKVKGNLFRLLQTADATLRWLAVLRTIPTAFEDAYADSSFEGYGD